MYETASDHTSYSCTLDLKILIKKKMKMAFKLIVLTFICYISFVWLYVFLTVFDPSLFQLPQLAPYVSGLSG